MQNSSTIEQKNSEPTKISYWGGVSLLLVGGSLFATNLLNIHMDNWWALFILAPALLLFGSGQVLSKSDNGRYSLLPRLFFGAGLIVLTVATMFLAKLDWSAWWPLMIMASSAALIIMGGKGNANPTSAAWIGYLRWTAVSIFGLGIVFLMHSFGIIDLYAFGEFRWWGFFIAFSAMGALLQAIRLYSRLGHFNFSVIALLWIVFLSSGTAVIELLGISWTIFYQTTAVLLIGSGIMLLLNGFRRKNK